jgi:CubicO group peptidase (beta-lactamase class C family)
MRIFIVMAALAWPALAPAQSFPTADPAEAGFDPDRLSRLTAAFDEAAGSGRLAGGVILVLRDGKAVVAHPFGHRDVERGDPMNFHSMFRIASQTKAVVSVGILMLQEEGRLLLSDPVSNYLPEFANTTVSVPREGGGADVVPARRAITIRDLLMHAAGIGYSVPGTDISGWYFAHSPETMRELVRRMPSQPFAAQPGERFVYGYATDILGVLIEEVTDMSLEAFLNERILGPLKMADTHFFVPPSKQDRLAVVYSATEQKGITRAPEPGGAVGQGHYADGPRAAQSGGAGLVSTAQDYARFLQMLLNGGELGGARILSPASVALMTGDHFDGRYGRPGLGFGLGFEVVTDVAARGVPGAVGDFGWGGAYHSHYWVSPKDRLVVVFLTQLIPATGSDAHGKLRTLLYQAIIQ